MYPRLALYDFPFRLFAESELNARLAATNVERLRREIRNMDAGTGAIAYRAPWNSSSVPPASADLVISQVALQDMSRGPGRDELAANLASMARWLKPDGIMSHQIDFSCPGGAPWNHHWTYGDFTWRVICGRRPYYVNRTPLSEYVSMIENEGCEVIGVQPVAQQGLRRAQATARFQRLPDSDFNTSAALIVARRR
jgi:hypothetical protein